MTINEFDAYTRSIFALDELSRIDAAYNGLQVGDGERHLRKLAVAVDACMESFRRAGDWGADMLFVHHGIMWGQQYPFVSTAYQRMKFLCEKDLALYALHLPLDRHPQMGNNAGLAAQLGLEDINPFGSYKGCKIGVRGRLRHPQTTEEISTRLFGDDRGTLGRLPFGTDQNTHIGIVSGGGAPYIVDEAIQEGLDLFITGDADHIIYHRCLEAGINVIFGGHYQTEVWGVSLFAKHVQERFGIETCFIDLPTGL